MRLVDVRYLGERVKWKIRIKLVYYVLPLFNVTCEMDGGVCDSQLFIICFFPNFFNAILFALLVLSLLVALLNESNAGMEMICCSGLSK